MDNILRDPLWTFIGVILALLAVIVMIVIFFAQRKKKSLTYAVLSNTQLLGLKDEIKGKVKILYEESEVKNVHLFSVKISNTGNVPISSSDYESKLKLKVNEGANVLTSEIIDEEPANLGASVEIVDNVFVFNSILLNPKDSYTLKTLVSDLSGSPIVEGRINGVKHIKSYSEGQISYILTSIISFVVIIFGFYFIERNEQVKLFTHIVPSAYIGFPLAITGYWLMFIVMFKNKRLFRLIAKRILK